MILGAAAAMLAPASAQAAPKTYVANKLGDHAPNGCTHADCTLREAVIKANNHPGSDTIKLRAATYTLALPGTDEDAATDGDLDLTQAVTIVGKGAGKTTVNAGGFIVHEAAFDVLASGGAAINGLTVRNSKIVNPSQQAGIFVADHAALRMRGARVVENFADGPCCAGIQSSPTDTLVKLSHVIVARNSGSPGSNMHGVFAADRATLDHVTVKDNTGNYFNGLNAYGRTILRHVQVLNNDGSAYDNGITLQSTGRDTLSDVVVRGNDGENCCNGLYRISGGGDASVSLNRVAVRNNDGPPSGCCNGLSLSSGSATLHRVIISGSDGGCCNGYEGGGGSARLTDVVVSDNDGIGCCQGLETASGAETIKRTTVSGNDDPNNGCVGICTSGTPLRLIDVTVSHNTAASNGAGIEQTGAGTLFLNNVTVTKNKADSDNAGGGFGGGIYVASGSATMQNSIVAGNTVGSTGAGPNCYGIIVSHGHNLIGDTSGCTIASGGGNLLGVSPGLKPLANNGGFTKTHALKRGSKALNHGSPKKPGSGGKACDRHDQRGVKRPQGPRCDIGAYERKRRHHRH